MKLIKKIFVLLLIFAFAFVLPVTVNAEDVKMAVETGDRGIIGIVIALAAFIATAFITTRLTKHKNKKIK